MKKIAVLFLLVMTLCACTSSNKVLVSDPDSYVIEGGTNLTKQELFETMKYNDYSSVVLGDMIGKIAVLEGVDMSEIDNLVTKDINDMKEQYGESYDAVMEYYGGESAIIQNIRLSYIGEKLSTAYYDANIDSLVSTYKPMLGKYVYFDTVEAAENMLKLISEGKTYEMAAAESGYGYSISESVMTDNSSLPLEVKEFINSVDKPTLSDVIISETATTNTDGTTTTNVRYYVVEVTDLDSNNFKDQFYSTLNSLVDSKDIYNFYFAKYNVEVYDQRTYDLLSSTYEGIK